MFDFYSITWYIVVYNKQIYFNYFSQNIILFIKMITGGKINSGFKPEQ